MAKNIPKVSHMSRCLGTVAVLVLCVTLADAAADAGSVVVNRQRDMKEIAVAAKTIAEMFKASDTYSSATFRQAARTVSERAGQRLTDHFGVIGATEGSKITEALATDHDRFEKLAADLKAYAEVLAKAADEHPNAMTDDMRMSEGEPMEGGILGSRKKIDASAMSAEHAFHMMLQTCTSCHSKFRAK